MKCERLDATGDWPEYISWRGDESDLSIIGAVQKMRKSTARDLRHQRSRTLMGTMHDIAINLFET